jgi:hypothetical protein
MPSRRKETPHLRVRIEPRLLERLEKAREKGGRTLTGEIVSRLEQSFRRQDEVQLLTSLLRTALDNLIDGQAELKDMLTAAERDRITRNDLDEIIRAQTKETKS